MLSKLILLLFLKLNIFLGGYPSYGRSDVDNYSRLRYAPVVSTAYAAYAPANLRTFAVANIIESDDITKVGAYIE